MADVHSACDLYLSLVRQQYPELMEEIGDVPIEIVSTSIEVDDIDRACALVREEAEQWGCELTHVREFVDDLIEKAPQIRVPKYHLMVVVRASGQEYGMTIRLPKERAA